MIEPLESRIAPASLTLTAVNFSSTASNAKTHQSLEFIQASNPGTNPANVAIAETVGNNSDVFFIKVSAGEDVRFPTSVGFSDIINVSQGTVVAFFTDSSPTALTNTHEFLDNPPTMTGLALGTKVSAGIGTAINGDVVTNYNATTGALGGASETSGNATQLLDNTVLSLTTAGGITGDFVAGGTVSRLQISGSVNAILTGTAANGYLFSFDGSQASAASTTLSVLTPAAHVAGPSVANVIVSSVNNITLGAGGPEAAGGSLANLTLRSDTTAVTLQAGAGGAGIAGRPVGGAGGSISGIVFNPPSAAVSSSLNNSLITITGGAGGSGAGLSAGGAGGAVTSVYVDYSAASTADQATNFFLPDDVTVQGGAGGTGGVAGAGGSLNNINVLVSTPHNTSLAAGTVELQLLGGAGGISALGGKGGAGGSVSNSFVENHALPVTPAPTISVPVPLPNDTVATSPTNLVALIEAGAGGSVAVRGVGGAGGSVGNLSLKGFNFDVDAGAGGQGISAGGAGGNIVGVNVAGSPGALPGDDFHAESLVVTAGAGGEGVTGRGGAGGTVNGLTVVDADFGKTGFDITAVNDIAAAGFVIAGGNGGVANKGAGGAGGPILNVSVTNPIDFLTLSHPLGNSGTASITTGNGGAAAVAGGTGGAGGAMSNVTVIGTRLAAPNVTTGNGGAGGVNAAAGKGGAGGTMTNVSIRVSEDFFPSVTTASTGVLYDPTATFTTDTIVVGDTVENTLTSATTTITAITSATQLALASDIFGGYMLNGKFVGDSYEIFDTNAPNPYLGTVADLASQNTIIDSSVNFLTEGITAGTVVQDDSDTLLYASATNDMPTTAVVTAVTAHQLTITSDISHVGDDYSIGSPVIVNLTAGNGGTGVLTGAGGAGGSIINSSANAPGTITLLGGTGGNSQNTTRGAAGAGGSLVGDGAFSQFGSGSLTAGNAGTGGKGAAGGSVVRANVQVLTNVSIIAGNGATASLGAGGAGGNVTESGYSGVLLAGGGFIPPAGNVTIQGGAGGGGGSSAVGDGGAGGSISYVTGFISTGNGASAIFTQFDGGAGGGGTAKGGAGGSVEHIGIHGGGGADVTFFINAGDAGNASTGRTGATGGSVFDVGAGDNVSSSGVANFSINSQTDFHHVSAGDGGNATLKGGLGGSVTNVFVNASIGVRIDDPFGFNITGIDGAIATGSGGISAGAGGTGTTPGLAGNVTSVTADAIASIVAGHLTAGQALLKTNLVTKVDDIILNGTTPIALAHNFTLTFGGVTTISLPTNATNLQVASALNNLTTIQSAGGVTVTTGTNGYVVTFNKTGAQAAISGAESVPSFTTQVIAGDLNTEAVQSVQVLAGAPFTLTFGGDTTTTLNTSTSTATSVQNALDALPSIGAGGVTVTFTPASGGANPYYTVTFNTNGLQALIVPNFLVGESSAIVSTHEVETITLPPNGTIELTSIGTANFVGSIVNPLSPTASTFDYTQLVAGSTFQFGDAPLDGLIAALTLTSDKNFVPQAFVTADASGNAVLIQ
jgi:hypothetical protein